MSPEIGFRLVNPMWESLSMARCPSPQTKKSAQPFGLRAVARLERLVAGGHGHRFRGELLGLRYKRLVRLVDSEQHHRQRA